MDAEHGGALKMTMDDIEALFAPAGQSEVQNMSPERVTA
jgi:hypothetical protein